MELDCVREIVKALGGLTAVSRLTGVSYITVSAWQTRLHVFPSKYFLVMTTELGRRGFHASPTLWGMLEAAE